MKSIIGILKIGTMGNIHTIAKTLEKLSIRHILISKPNDFSKCDKIIIPGVGYFGKSISFLEQNQLLEPLQQELKKKHTLGICLGMQLLAHIGYEGGENNGLQILDGMVSKIQTNLPVPHLGFNTIEIIKDSPIFKDLKKPLFYFMHSYHLVCYTHITSLTHYGNTPIIASIQKDNIFGTQFHPECSREDGMKIFENFSKL